MGYKLAGYDVVGGVEIDPEMMKIYRDNHNPKHSFLMGVQKFRKIPNEDLPSELFNLDILDGSPPCSSFSMVGSREDKWGVKKKFREGQVEQVLDDLFFDFIDIAKKLKPKVVIAENVKGLIQGNARGYVKEIHTKLREAGYDCQLFLLNSAFMGVPQIRERTFFVARRRDLDLPKIRMEFNENPIPLVEAFVGIHDSKEKITDQQYKFWNLSKEGESFSKYHPKGFRFSQSKANSMKPSKTLTTKTDTLFHWKYRRYLNLREWIRIGVFPEDYKNVSKYLIGMSVPPFMTQRISNQIYKQWLHGYGVSIEKGG